MLSRKFTNNMAQRRRYKMTLRCESGTVVDILSLDEEWLVLNDTVELRLWLSMAVGAAVVVLAGCNGVVGRRMEEERVGVLVLGDNVFMF